MSSCLLESISEELNSDNCFHKINNINIIIANVDSISCRSGITSVELLDVYALLFAAALENPKPH